jgi:hypothetical protein
MAGAPTGVALVGEPASQVAMQPVFDVEHSSPFDQETKKPASHGGMPVNKKSWSRRRTPHLLGVVSDEVRLALQTADLCT